MRHVDTRYPYWRELTGAKRPKLADVRRSSRADARRMNAVFIKSLWKSIEGTELLTIE